MNLAESSTLLILGLGRSGLAAAELSLSRGHSTTVLDSADSPSLRRGAVSLRAKGAAVHLGWSGLCPPAPADLVVVSPGIAADSPLGRLADSLGCPVISELEYGFRHCACPILAITGTNGKTTTTQAVTHCLTHCGLHVISAGNIGLPLSAVAEGSAELDFAVVEVSSFQLERIDAFEPAAVAFLNLTPDHYDRYAGPEQYLNAKLRVLRNMRRADRVVLRWDLAANSAVRTALPSAGGVPVRFRSDGQSDAEWFVSGDGTTLCRRDTTGAVEPIVNVSCLHLAGRHNFENALATLALCELAGVPVRDAARALVGFMPGRHRLEEVAHRDGVRYINDSKSTNPDSLHRAVEALSTSGGRRNILLIAGGLDKGLDHAELKPVLAGNARRIFLVGTCRKRLANLWSDVVSCKEFASLAAAVDAAIAAARPGDVVLLSPGCSSQDMFSDYAERGNVFCEHVKRRIGA